MPLASSLPTPPQVYDWLQGLLENVWKDPVCGDGLCEAPFEYASYSRFGCKADCGRLQEVQNLTTVQVDVYFDFAHPIGSIPAADLMTQASWNLCPVESKFSANCYFADDITFERLSGSQTYIIEDMPDGQWDLMLRRDTFNKLRGAVRDWAKLQTVGLYYKVAVAALAAEVEADYEIGLLQQAVDLSAVPLRYYVLDQLAAGGGDWPKEAAEEELEQMLTGACACTPLADPDLVQAIFNNTVHPSDNATLYPDSGDLWEFCTGGAEPSDPAAYTVNDIVYWMEATGVTNGDVVQVPGREPVINRTAYPEAEYAFELKWDVNETVTVDDAWCGASTWALASGGGYTGGILGKLWAWRVKQTVAVQRLAIDLRLGDGRSTGKAAQSLKVSLIKKEATLLPLRDCLL